jgi:hypothetical protein
LRDFVMQGLCPRTSAGTLVGLRPTPRSRDFLEKIPLRILEKPPKKHSGAPRRNTARYAVWLRLKAYCA